MTPECCTASRVRIELVGGPADGQTMTMAPGPDGLPPYRRINVPAAPPGLDLRIVEPGEALQPPTTMFDHLVYDMPAAVSDHDHVWRYTYAGG